MAAAAFDPVEKVVETLFFHLVFKACPDRDFVYAPLSGNAESRFGDALAFVGRVFVFEFKRSLENVDDEVKKFKRLEATDEIGFATKLAVYASSVAVDPLSLQTADLLLKPPPGHFFVALNSAGPLASDAAAPMLFKPGTVDHASLDIRPYLKRLRGMSQASLPLTKREQILGLGDALGMPVASASAYFEALQALKRSDDDKGWAEGLFACLAIDERGTIGIFHGADLLQLALVFRQLTQHNLQRPPTPTDGTGQTARRLDGQR